VTGRPPLALSTTQPTLRVKMLAWSAELDLAKNGRKLVPSVDRSRVGIDCRFRIDVARPVCCAVVGITGDPSRERGDGDLLVGPGRAVVGRPEVASSPRLRAAS
jgi:hypothetical protein